MSRVKYIDGTHVIRTQFEVEHVDVLGDSTRLGGKEILEYSPYGFRRFPSQYHPYRWSRTG